MRGPRVQSPPRSPNLPKESSKRRLRTRDVPAPRKPSEPHRQRGDRSGFWHGRGCRRGRTVDGRTNIQLEISVWERVAHVPREAVSHERGDPGVRAGREHLKPDNMLWDAVVSSPQAYVRPDHAGAASEDLRRPSKVDGIEGFREVRRAGPGCAGDAGQS